MKNKSVSKPFSSFIIKCLKNNGKNLTNRKIASLIDKPGSFIEDILEGKENFTIGQLQKIGGVYKGSLPLILMEEIEKQPIPASMRNAHKNLRGVINAYENIRVTQSSGSTGGVQIEIAEIKTTRRKTAEVDIKHKKHGGRRK